MDETKLKQFVTLLVQSTMDQKMKDAIMANIEIISIEEFDNLLLALQNEEKALRKISNEIAEVVEEDQDSWDSLKIEQRNIADEVIAKAAKELGEEAAASSIRNSLN